jgi:putative colanic acid biosynthesis UDP-glucose lipid carrier transferase
MPIQKYFVRWYYASKMADRNNIPLVIVGAGEMGMEFYNNVVEKGDFGYKLVGFLDDAHKPHLNGKYLGVTEELNHFLQKHNEVEDVIVALPGKEVDKIKRAIRVSELHAKRVRVIPDYHAYTKSASFSYIGSMPLISPRPVLLDDPELRLFKRIGDLVITGIAFIFIFSWLFPVIAIIIKLTSKGPVFFKQKRWGVHKFPIYCYKFRTMVHNSSDVDEKGVYQQATKNDPRVTKFGKFLRKTSLDELPQFINVLKGSMSIVGPRPHPIPLNLESKDKIDDYMRRNLVKPGITGWAQVNGYRGETKDKPAKMQARINHDIWYIENWSLWLDMQIILQTVINIFKGEKNAY